MIYYSDKGKCVLQGNLKEIKDSYDSNKLEIITNDNIDNHLKILSIEILIMSI